MLISIKTCICVEAMSGVQFDSSFTKEEYEGTIQANFTTRSLVYNHGVSGEIHRHFVEMLVTFYPPVYPLLDVACGSGLLGAHLGTGEGVYGLDLTEAMLALARQDCPKGTFVQGNATSLPFDEEFFGSLYICSALVYFTDIPGCFKEGYRVLKDGGFLAYQAVTLDSYVAGVVLEKAVWDVLGEERGRFVFQLPHGITNDEDANMKLMKDAGFVDVSIQKDVVVDHLETEKLEDWWDGYVKQNGMMRRVAKLSDEEQRAIHKVWVDGMEKRRGADNRIEDRITSWYVRGYKRTNV